MLPISQRATWSTRSRSYAAARLLPFFAFGHLASAEPISVADFGELSLRCGSSVAPSTLASIAQTESAFQPLTINDNTTHTSGVPASRDLAIQLASKLLEAGHSLDIGIMQINSANFRKLGLTLEAALDPCRSIAAAAAILVGDFSGSDDTHDGQQAALRVAISKYNTGDAQRGFENGYVHKVELSARHVVPALDVGVPSTATDSAPHAITVPAVAADPNAPPTWDVWAAYEYGAAHRAGAQAVIAAFMATHPGRTELADAGREPSAPANILSSNSE